MLTYYGRRYATLSELRELFGEEVMQHPDGPIAFSVVRILPVRISSGPTCWCVEDVEKQVAEHAAWRLGAAHG